VGAVLSIVFFFSFFEWGRVLSNHVNELVCTRQQLRIRNKNK